MIACQRRTTRGIISAQVTRFLVGGVLLAGAGLKAYQLLHQPQVAGRTGTFSITGWATLVVIESGLALWILGGWRWGIARTAAIAWMAAVCVYSLHEAATGVRSCGCFGDIEVNPRLTFALDCAALASLALCASAANRRLSALRTAALIGSQIVIIAAIGLIVRRAVASAPPAPVSIVELDPTKWPSELSWQLGEYIDAWDDISRGKWAVLLYNRNCRACTTARDSYDELARSWQMTHQPQRVALIETTADPALPDEDDPGTVALHGVLGAAADWDVPTPTLVILVDGHVVEADVGFEASQWGNRKFPAGH